MLKLIGTIREVDVGEEGSGNYFPKMKVAILGVLSSICETMHFGVAMHPVSGYWIIITGICEHPKKPYVLASSQTRELKDGITQASLTNYFTLEEVKYMLAGARAYESLLDVLREYDSNQ